MIDNSSQIHFIQLVRTVAVKRIHGKYHGMQDRLRTSSRAVVHPGRSLYNPLQLPYSVNLSLNFLVLQYPSLKKKKKNVTNFCRKR
jgi:hypothetical protein